MARQITCDVGQPAHTYRITRGDRAEMMGGLFLHETTHTVGWDGALCLFRRKVFVPDASGIDVSKVGSPDAFDRLLHDLAEHTSASLALGGISATVAQAHTYPDDLAELLRDNLRSKLANDKPVVRINDYARLEVHLAAQVPSHAIPRTWGAQDVLDSISYLALPCGRYARLTDDLLTELDGIENARISLEMMGEDVAWFDEHGAPIQRPEVR